MRRAFLIACAICFLAPSLASAAIFNLTADMDGLQAGTGSSGTGSGAMTYDDVSGLLDWDISWSGLSGPATVMHFHGPAAPGFNAGVQVDIGGISGTTSPTIGSTTISASQGADLLAGLWYINIHTAQDPGGEIRGQVNVVPLPMAGWLFGSALLGLAAVKRKKA